MLLHKVECLIYDFDEVGLQTILDSYDTFPPQIKIISYEGAEIGDYTTDEKHPLNDKDKWMLEYEKYF